MLPSLPLLRSSLAAQSPRGNIEKISYFISIVFPLIPLYSYMLHVWLDPFNIFTLTRLNDISFSETRSDAVVFAISYLMRFH